MFYFTNLKALSISVLCTASAARAAAGGWIVSGANWTTMGWVSKLMEEESLRKVSEPREPDAPLKSGLSTPTLVLTQRLNVLLYRR